MTTLKVDIQKLQEVQVNPRKFVVEASEIGIELGVFPLILDIDGLGICTKQETTKDLVRYQSYMDAFTVDVLID